MNRLLFTIGLATLAIGLLGPFFPGVMGLSTTSPSTYYSTCQISSQTTGIVVTGCTADLIGPQPDGSVTGVFTVDVLGGSCSSGSYTWAWSDGSTSSVDVVNSASAVPEITRTFTVTSGQFSASGTISLFDSPGTSTFTDPFFSVVNSCSSTTSTSSTSSVPNLTTSLSSRTPLDLALIAGGAILSLTAWILPEKRAIRQ